MKHTPTLNLLTGFGSIDRFSHPDRGIWVEAMTRFHQPLEKIEENLEHVTEAIYDDLENFVLVKQYSFYNKDQQAMLYSH